MFIDYKKEGRTGIFTINRPDARNSISLQVNKELCDALMEFRDDNEVWVGIITGAGDKAFCAGADIKDMLPYLREHREKPWDMPVTPMTGLEVWKPLIAAINGVAAGGGLELALTCDIRIAAQEARLGLSEVTLGLMPGWGGTQRLPRMIPWCKAAEIILMGKLIDAQEAYRIGLVNKVVPAAEVMTTAKQWAETMCQAGPLAIRKAKEAMIRGYSMPLADGLRLERGIFAYLLGTEDFNEGIAAFGEKRKPVYKGK